MNAIINIIIGVVVGSLITIIGNVTDIKDNKKDINSILKTQVFILEHIKQEVKKDQE